MLKKGIDVIVLLFDDTLSIDVTFFETTPFSLSSTIIIVREEDDDLLLVYTISSPSLASTRTPVPVKPPITQVYSRCQNPLISSPTPDALSSDPIQNDDLPIALCKRQ